MARFGTTALAVVADDRTGALETAGACADAGLGPVLVATDLHDGPVSRGRCVVVDMATRHLGADEARRAAVRADDVDAPRHAHKIDSGLRGNWASELVARQRAGGRRVLVVPANPGVGRTCVGGVVLVDGRPVHLGSMGDDARAPISTSRPADHLRRADATAIAELTTRTELVEWLAAEGPAFGVCDASTGAQLEDIAHHWWPVDGVIFAGTAASIGAAASSATGGSISMTSHQRPPGPCLVVCGSVHPAARRQVDVLVAQGAAHAVIAEDGSPIDDARAAMLADRPGVLVTSMPAEVPVGADAARSMAASLAAAARRLWTAGRPGTVVVVGGDTAAALLGPGPLVVLGTVAPGTPVSWRPDFAPPMYVTRSGAFGDDHALADLLSVLEQ